MTIQFTDAERQAFQEAQLEFNKVIVMIARLRGGMDARKIRLVPNGLTDDLEETFTKTQVEEMLSKQRETANVSTPTSIHADDSHSVVNSVTG